MRAPEALCCVWWVLAGCEGGNLVLGAGHSLAGADAGAALAGQMANAMDAGAAGQGGASDAGAGALEMLRFREPRLIEELVAASEAKDDDPSLTTDRLLLCFNSRRDGGSGKEDIWCSERANLAERWGKPQPLAALNTDARETGIALALDGLALWFSSDRDEQDSLDVYVSRRESRTAQWSAPERVPALSTHDDDLVSGVDAEARTLYLARRVDDDDDYDLYLATRADAQSAWYAPVLIEELTTDAEESDAYPVAEGRGLLFTRKGELMLARRKSLAERFESPQPLAALNSSRDDRDAWAEPDMSYVVFSSDRSGEYRLYETEVTTGEP